MNVMHRLWIDDRGQDLVEYILLGATVGLAGVIAASVFPGVINAVYTSWDTATQSLWYPPDPAP